MRHTIPVPETVKLDRPRDGVAVLTLARPDRSNAMTDLMFGEFEAVALALDQEEGLRVLILPAMPSSRAVTSRAWPRKPPWRYCPTASRRR